MLVAWSEIEKNMVPSDEVLGGSFSCPECSHPVILKKGRFKIPHFAHRPGSDCSLSKGEGAEHMKIKMKLYRRLKEAGWETQMEAKVGECRTDIMASKGDRRFCIEIQLSSISPNEIDKRMREHWRNGYTTLWIIHSDELMGARSKKAVKIKKWWMYLQKLQYGSVWTLDIVYQLRAVNFSSYYNGERWLKTTKIAVFGPDTLRMLSSEVFYNEEIGCNAARIQLANVFWKERHAKHHG